jgi:putative ABC transport system substrate-binding protein
MWASPAVPQPLLSRKARLGFLSNAVLSTQRPYQQAFLSGLRELGWVEGVNIDIEYRFADGQMTRLPALARELVESRVDVIVTAGPLAIQACQQASRTVPIVVAIMPDPMHWASRIVSRAQAATSPVLPICSKN